jgi:4,5-DOPA dioxygenase extradiol
VLAVSAHSTARAPVLLAASQHPTIHDFGGFPDELYQLRYDAAGAPALAEEVQRLYADAGVPVHKLDEGGLDHGLWSVLRFMYPQVDIPVLPLAWVPSMPPAQQFAMGEVLRDLGAHGVLVMGTGSITHNLRRLSVHRSQTGWRMGADTVGEEIVESAEFRRWMAERSAARDWDALYAYRSQAPYAADMHPTDEHLLPWFVAAGAGGREATPVRLFEDVIYGCLGMDAYAFGPQAAALRDALAEAEKREPVTT